MIDQILKFLVLHFHSENIHFDFGICLVGNFLSEIVFSFCGIIKLQLGRRILFNENVLHHKPVRH